MPKQAGMNGYNGGRLHKHPTPLVDMGKVTGSVGRSCKGGSKQRKHGVGGRGDAGCEVAMDWHDNQGRQGGSGVGDQCAWEALGQLRDLQGPGISRMGKVGQGGRGVFFCFFLNAIG